MQSAMNMRPLTQLDQHSLAAGHGTGQWCTALNCMSSLHSYSICPALRICAVKVSEVRVLTSSRYSDMQPEADRCNAIIRVTTC